MTTVMAAGIVGGCAADQAAKTDFWPALSAQALEKDQPQSLDELIDKSDSVVRGVITGGVAGPGKEAGCGPDTPIAVLLVAVQETVEGSVPGNELQVIVARDPLVSIEELAAQVPTDPIVLFIEPAGVDDYWVTSSQLGIVAQTDGGQLETVLVPELSEAAIAPDVDGISDFVEEVEAAEAG
jgi:hypothetical protein